MKDFVDVNESLGIELTVQQALAFRFLERHGLRYLIDFGYGNAIQKAREIAAKAPRNREQLFTPRSS